MNGAARTASRHARQRLSLRRLAGAASRGWTQWWTRWWHILHLGALLCTLLLTPSVWRVRAVRAAIGQRVWQSASSLWLGFALMSALLGLVIARIVLVTASSYGLSELALEMVVRVLVLELLPLGATLFVALRIALPVALEVAQLRGDASLRRLRSSGVDILSQELLPRACGGAFAVWLLMATSSLICLVLTYVMAYGLSPWGLESYTRMVGRVFSPTISLIFGLKSLAFAAAVAVVPLGSALHDPQASAELAERGSVELQGLVRLFAALLVIEALSLGVNYV